MKIIFDYNRTIFNPDTSTLYDGVLGVLQKLSINNELFLISKNEPNRKNTIKKLNINNYFKKIILVEEKTTDIFYGLTDGDKEVFVIGDRIKGEISIGNLLGFKTIWIKQGKFLNDTYKNKYEKPDYIIYDIRQLLEIFKKYE